MTAKRCPSCDVELHEDGSATYKGPAPKTDPPAAGAGDPPAPNPSNEPKVEPPAKSPGFSTFFEDLAGGGAS